MIGDSTLYQRGDAVEAAWKFVDPVLKAWRDDTDIPLYGYSAGTWGPDNADNIIEDGKFKWRYPCKNLINDGLYCEL
jgi:glucose-6-phosphate 1-dehydrogenase